MLWVIIGCIFGIYFGIFTCKDLYEDKWWKDQLYVAMFVLLVMLCVSFGALVYVLIGDIIPENNYNAEDVTTEPVYCINDTTQISGSMSGTFLFIAGNANGNIDENTVYKYMTQDDIGKIMHSVPAKSSHILEDEDTNPYVEIHHTYHKRDHPNWQYVWIYMEPPIMSTYHKYSYVFHLPKNSVSTQYRIDLEK